LLSPQKTAAADRTIRQGFDLNKALDDLTEEYIKEALNLSNGNMKKASSVLGINYRSIRYLIDKHGINSRHSEQD